MLTFLIWVFGIIVASRLLIRFVFPLVIKYFLKRNFRKFDQFSKQQKESIKKEGEITIETTDRDIKTKSNNVGEYIDYEEIQ